jgi:hypothetical protein
MLKQARRLGFNRSGRSGAAALSTFVVAGSPRFGARATSTAPAGHPNHRHPPGSKRFRRCGTRAVASLGLGTALALGAQAAPLPLAPQAPVAETSIGPTPGPTLLRTVLPLPEGTYPGLLPYSAYALRAGGQVLPTQAAPVRFHADGTVASVELIATYPGNVASNSVDVVPAQHTDQTFALHPDVLDPLFQGLTFRVRGPQGQASANLLGHGGVIKLGPVRAEYEHGGSLGDFGGFKTWVRSYSNWSAIEVDLLWHNGDTDSPDPDIRFDRLELDLPEGWTAESRIPRPDFFMESAAGGERLVMAEGRNVLLMLHEHAIRLVLHPPSGEDQARDLRNYGGFGIAKPKGAWSYWSSETPWYTAHGTAMPELAHFSPSSLINKVQDRWDTVRTALENGTSMPGSADGKLGFLHPEGVPYGGATGGQGLEVRPEPLLAIHGSPMSIATLISESFCDLARGTGHLYAANGNPVDLDAWAPNGELNLQFHLVAEAQPGLPPVFSADDPFGFTQVVEKLASDPDAAPYEDQIRKYGRHDEQHGSRFLRRPLALASLINDPLSKHLIRARATAVRASNWEGAGTIYTATLAKDLEAVIANPGQGHPLGRAEAWNLWTMAEAYALTAPSQRAKYLPWIESQVLALVGAQMPNGLILRIHEGKSAQAVSPPGTPNNQLLGACQSWSACLQGGALLAAGRAAFPPGNWRTTSLQGVLKALDGQAWAWRPDKHKPYELFAVADDENSPPYVSLDTVPNESKLDATDFYLTALLGDAFSAASELGADASIILASGLLVDWANGTDLTQKITYQKGHELGMHAPILSIVESVPSSLLETLASFSSF